uniref:Uncharacterized protein n=1 Tax=uncultured bacterium ws020C1 TaxID=1131823 RepID=I1X4K6_9BACT|nr:hypothetical protein ws020C1_0026 [uncultured bacterium ws020C1]
MLFGVGDSRCELNQDIASKGEAKKWLRFPSFGASTLAVDPYTSGGLVTATLGLLMMSVKYCPVSVPLSSGPSTAARLYLKWGIGLAKK